MSKANQDKVLKPLTIITIFLSSYLLFLVQPIISKYLLPWFGGSSAVWIVALLFFQGLLLAGYLYAYVLIRLPFRRQLKIHFLVSLVIGCIMLWLLTSWPSAIISTSALSINVNYPIQEILKFLLSHVALPYFLLATTSTLIQYWIGHAKIVAVPYTFYSISNLASFLAVISYPFLIEPLFGVINQSRAWSIFYLGFILVLIYTVYLLLKSQYTKPKKISSKVNLRQLLLWLGLSATSTALLMATTIKITQAVAPVPFLWLLPLCFFLLSYVVAFSERQILKPFFYPLCFVVFATLTILLSNPAIVVGLGYELVIYTITLFSGFTTIHLYLYTKRPQIELLRAYYLIIAAGGFLGGVFVALTAPVIFNDNLEFYLAFLATYLITALFVAKELQLFPQSYKLNERIVISILLVLVIFGSAYYQTETIIKDEILHKSRNFYTAVEVAERNQDGVALRYLKHGTIIHGGQITQDERRYEALLYYAPTSGAGKVFKHTETLLTQPRRIGVMGLGVGTLAAFGREGETIDFYELDPQIVDIAYDYFTYLSDTPADVNIIIGDARLSLADSQTDSDYDILVMDAFSDDSIPMHLLTSEAFALYLDRLTESGVLLVNISNNYIDLAPLLKVVAETYQLDLRILLNKGERFLDGSSEWAILTRNQPLLVQLDAEVGDSWRDISQEKPIRLWTDDYSNLFAVLKH